jgi:L-amino acid ligase C-terminal domain 2
VMMIPIPRAGRLQGIVGEADAKAVPSVEDVAITAHIGQELIPLPEGWQYLGFIFARAETPDQVEKALRAAHAQLGFDIA